MSRMTLNQILGHPVTSQDCVFCFAKLTLNIFQEVALTCHNSSIPCGRHSLGLGAKDMAASAVCQMKPGECIFVAWAF